MTEGYKRTLSKLLQSHRNEINSWNPATGYSNLCSLLNKNFFSDESLEDRYDLKLYLGVILKIPARLLYHRGAKVIELLLDKTAILSVPLTENMITEDSIRSQFIDRLLAKRYISIDRRNLLLKLISPVQHIEIVI